MATADNPTTHVTPETTDFYYEEPAPRGAGWLAFSALVLGFGGAWVAFEGILAIFKSKVYVANASYVFSDLRTWGWIMLGLGTLAVLAACAIFTGSELARWFGVTIAVLNAWGQLMFLQAQPWWAMTMFTIDILVIYGLVAYGGHKLRRSS
jgi:hypothetical protein